MRKEYKIILPFYKIAYAVCFVILLSLVRGVSVSHEVGIALEPHIALLAAVFCADTYVAEITAKRSEVWRLYSLKKILLAIYSRIFLQILFLFLLAAAGYGLFFLFQKPTFSANAAYEAAQFFVFLASILITIAFWGHFSKHPCLCFSQYVVCNRFLPALMDFNKLKCGRSFSGKMECVFLHVQRNK